MCVNPASASLVDRINKCKNRKSLGSCLHACGSGGEDAEACILFTCAHMVSMCNRCEINKSCRGAGEGEGWRGVVGIWGWGRGFLQIATHIFKKASPAFAARNVINTTDGGFVVPNVLLQMKLIPDRCIYAAA